MSGSNTHEPIISFVVPVHNGEATIAHCLDSILRQDLDLEIIVVDDASTDNTSRIVGEIKDQRVKYVCVDKTGAAGARNTGVLLASGRYIAFVDADDWLESEAYSKIYAAGLDADVILVDAHKVFPDGGSVDLGNGYSDAFGTSRIIGQEIRKACTKLKKMPAAPWDKLLLKEFAIRHPFPKGRFVEDLDWAMRVFVDARSIKYIPVSAYAYRQSISSTSSKRSTDFIEDYFWFFRKWLDYDDGDCDRLAMVSRFLTAQTYVFMGIFGQAEKETRLAKSTELQSVVSRVLKRAIPVRIQEKITLAIVRMLRAPITARLLGIALAARTMREQKSARAINHE